MADLSIFCVLLFVAASLLLRFQKQRSSSLSLSKWSSWSARSDDLKPRKSSFARRARLPTVSAWRAVRDLARGTTYEELLREGHRSHGTVFAVEDPFLVISSYLLDAKCHIR